MPITNYTQFSQVGYEGQLSSPVAPHDIRNFLSAKLFQVSTVDIDTGDATPGWVLLVTNTTTGEVHTLTYNPVDTAVPPVASAVDTDAARTLKEQWNARPDLFIVATATLSGTIVTFTFKTTNAYTVASTPAGSGAATDALVSAGGGITAIMGRFQFFDATAAVAESSSPIIITGVAGTLINLAGMALRSNYQEQGINPGDLVDTWRLGADVACVRKGQVRMLTTTAVTPATTPQIITSAGVNLGRINGSAGLDISAFAKFTHSAAANTLVELYYDLQTAR